MCAYIALVKKLLPMKSSLRLPLWGTGRGMPCEVETRLSRPTSAARLLPTISSPSLTAEGRNPLVGGGDAVRAARFAWLLANPGIGREGNQQLRAGSLLPARRLRMGTTEAGRGCCMLIQ